MSSVQNYRQARRHASRVLQTSPHRAHDLIRSSIRTGMLGEDGALIEDVLVRSLSTSRNAVRQALQMLATEGLLDRRPNRGTTVVGELIDIDFDQLVPSTAFLSPRASVRELDHRRIEGTSYLNGRLDIANTPIDVSEVLISIDDEPMSVRVSYISAPDHLIERVNDVVPFATAFQQVFGVALGSSEASIGAVPTGPSTGKILGIAEGSPIIVQEMLLRDVNGVPRELSYTHYRADRVALSVQHNFTPPSNTTGPSGPGGPTGERPC
jgi:GntR family transcriptional regulator